MAGKTDALHARPLYLYDLPKDILTSLYSKTAHEEAPSQVDDNDAKSDSHATPVEDGAAAKATSCSLCGLAFAGLQEQRSHVRSDLHAYNLKQKARGRKAVTEAEFEQLIRDLDESLSGSDSSDSDSDSDEDAGPANKPDTLSQLLKRQANVSDTVDDSFTTRKRKRGAGKPPLVWFGSSVHPSNISLGIYRSMFTPEEQTNERDIAEVVRQKQLPPKPPPKNPEDGGVALPNTATGPHIFLCMIGGGHFAAMIVSLAPKLGKKQGADERQASVLAHKTFHRYTTRRKQGGAQSANDSAKGAAHSAGSSLRRYNETALTEEVRELLSEWRGLINTSDLLFVRATGSTNRRTLFGPYDGQVLQLKDVRLRGFPFSTRRATQSELMRCFVELTRVKVSEVDEAAVAAAKLREESAKEEAREAAARAKRAPEQKSSEPVRTEEEETNLLHTTQIESLIKRNKAPQLLSYLSQNSLPPDFRLWPPDSTQHHHAPTALHMAANFSAAPVVRALLTRARADPTVQNGNGMTPYEICNDQETAEAFRIARHELGEEAWPWKKAHMPKGISQQELQKQHERVRRDKLDQGAKDRDTRLAELRKEEERQEQEKKQRGDDRREQKLGKPKILGANVEKSFEEKRQEEAKGMTPEMRARLERERRARAAEERMRRMQGGAAAR